MAQKKILLISVAVAVVLVAVSFILNIAVVSINLILIASIIAIAPYSIYRFIEFRRIRAYETEFPNFLRDLAESQRAGLSIIQAIKTAVKSEYGYLTKEIVKMDNQLSWNVPMETVLNDFSKRMEGSKLITRSVMIIHQANKSGGNVEDTMNSLAENIESLKDVQKEKSLLLNQQVIMMYAIFFIFLGISIALIKFLVPLLETQGLSTGFAGIGFSQFGANPCQPCISSSTSACMGCHAFFSVASSFDFGTPDDAAAYYRSLFFIMIMVQGFFSGLIAGQIGSDSVIAGIKHSIIMLIVGFSVFMISVNVGFI